MFQNAPFQAKVNNQKCCHQVRFSSSKYTKMRLQSLQRSPDPLAGSQGPLRGRGGRGRKRRGGDWRGGKGNGRGHSPTSVHVQFNHCLYRSGFSGVDKKRFLSRTSTHMLADVHRVTKKSPYLIAYNFRKC